MQKKKVFRRLQNAKRIIIASLIIFFGLILFKFIPMQNYGKDILWDASSHISIAILVMYLIWFFVDQSKQLRIPYLMICLLVLFIISIQRIIENAHNDIGLLKGFLLGMTAILISYWDKIKSQIDW